MWFFKIKKIIRKRKPTKINTLYKKHKEDARTLIHDRLEYWAPICGVIYKRISIRDTKRSWGSCSSKGNLNFSYKLQFLPKCVADYIIVHELCHLKELNHSERFWSEVEAVMPNYLDLKNELRTLEKTKGTSIPILLKYNESHTCQNCSATLVENDKVILD